MVPYNVVAEGKLYCSTDAEMLAGQNRENIERKTFHNDFRLLEIKTHYQTINTNIFYFEQIF